MVTTRLQLLSAEFLAVSQGLWVVGSTISALTNIPVSGRFYRNRCPSVVASKSWICLTVNGFLPERCPRLNQAFSDLTFGRSGAFQVRVPTPNVLSQSIEDSSCLTTSVLQLMKRGPFDKRIGPSWIVPGVQVVARKWPDFQGIRYFDMQMAVNGADRIQGFIQKGFTSTHAGVLVPS